MFFVGVLGNKRGRCDWELQEKSVERAKMHEKGSELRMWRLGTEGRRREAESQILALHWGREVGSSGWGEILRSGKLTI